MCGRTELFMVVWALGVFWGVLFERWRHVCVVQAKTRKDVEFQYLRRTNSGLFWNLVQSLFAFDCVLGRFFRQYPQQFYTCFRLSRSTDLRASIVFIFCGQLLFGNSPTAVLALPERYFVRWSYDHSWWPRSGGFFCIVVAGMVSPARHGLAVAQHLWVHIAIVKFEL